MAQEYTDAPLAFISSQLGAPAFSQAYSTMAPPPGRGKHATRSTRGGTSGGIQKRRGTPRLDRDGDIPMDAAAKASNHPAASGSGGNIRARGRSSARLSSRIAQNMANYANGEVNNAASRGGRGALGQGSKARFANTAKLKVLGLKNSKASNNADGGERGLLEFLERKASRGDKKITINRSQIDGDYVFLNVSKEDVPDFLRLNTYSYAGGELSITETNEPWPSKTRESGISHTAQETRDKITAVVISRYDSTSRILDLSALGQDPVLSSMGTFNDKNLAEKAFKTLVHLAAAQHKSADAVQGVSLANNGLDNVSQVFDLADQFPHLKRLDLNNNNIDSLSKLGRWRYKFKQLEELYLLENLIVTQVPQFHTELLQWFPRLQLINGQQVRTAQDVEALANSKVVPIPQLSSNFRDVNNLGENFVREFFRLYDADRPSLANTFYDADSSFSLAVSTPKEDTNTPVLSWKPYIRFSRNLAILNDPAAKAQRLFHGPAVITDLWSKLPATKHPAIEDGLKWIMDCHQIPQGTLSNAPLPTSDTPDGLFITVFGEFDEYDTATGKTGKRSFSRGFVLGPGRTERSPIRVVSDMLLIQSHRPHGPTDPPQAPAGLTDELKQKIIRDLSARTGMTVQYAQMCCEGPQANWNFHLALLSFENLKSSLPPDAFVSAPIA